MDKEKLKQWLDNLVIARNSYLENADLTDEICVCTGTFDDGIHIHLGIDKVADVMGLDLKEKYFEDNFEEYFMRNIYLLDCIKNNQLSNIEENIFEFK